LDIEDFFGSISEDLIRESITYYCKIEDIDEKERVLDTIVSIVTYQNHILQGLVTSPTISNIIFRELDIRIQKYCKKFDANYTRYADDLLLKLFYTVQKLTASGVQELLEKMACFYRHAIFVSLTLH